MQQSCLKKTELPKWSKTEVINHRTTNCVDFTFITPTESKETTADEGKKEEQRKNRQCVTVRSVRWKEDVRRDQAKRKRAYKTLQVDFSKITREQEREQSTSRFVQ